MTFSTFSKHLSTIEATAKRNEMTVLLAGLLKEASADEIDKVVSLSLGQLAPLYAHKEFGLAEKMVIRAIARAYGKEESAVRTQNRKSGDLGVVAQELASHSSPSPAEQSPAPQDHPSPPPGPSVSSVFSSLSAIAGESGSGSQERKLYRVAVLLSTVSPLDARYIVRIILDKLRLGFSDKTVLDALSVLTKGDKSDRERIEAAYNVRPDVGWLAKEIKDQRSKIKDPLRNITPRLGTPVLPALCQRLPSTEEIVKKMGKVAVEPKWDGQRIQAHMSLNSNSKLKTQNFRQSRIPLRGTKLAEIKLFTRSLEDVTDMFPDLVESLKKLASLSQISISNLILDGEVIGVDPKSGNVLPFQTMITRKRKYGIAEHLKSVPIRYMVFDILFLNGESLMDKPFSARRGILEQIFSHFNHSDHFSHSLSLAPQVVTSDPTIIREYLHKQTSAGLEGIVAKQWSDPYIPGRTGFTWVKMKWEGMAKTGGLLDTIDCVVMGTYAGRGKRSGFGVGAFLVGIYSPYPPGPSVPSYPSFLTVSKIGTGLSDEQWRELSRRARPGSAGRAKGQPKEYDVPKGLTPDTWLEPKIVVEIQADNLTKSPLHTAGYALRFPRLVRYRTDKRPEQITTLQELKKLYQLQ